MLGTVVRFIVSAFVLLFTSWLLPGMSVNGFVGAIITAAIIAALGYAAEKLMGDNVSPRNRGLTGFITAAVVIYLAQFIIPGLFQVSFIGSILAALIIGFIDYFVPTVIR